MDWNRIECSQVGKWDLAEAPLPAVFPSCFPSHLRRHIADDPYIFFATWSKWTWFLGLYSKLCFVNSELVILNRLMDGYLHLVAILYFVFQNFTFPDRQLNLYRNNSLCELSSYSFEFKNSSTNCLILWTWKLNVKKDDFSSAAWSKHM